MLGLIFGTSEQVNAGGITLANIFLADENFLGIIGSNQRRENGNQHQKDENGASNNGRTLPPDALQCHPEQTIGSIIPFR
jgi:hypothetical protein